MNVSELDDRLAWLLNANDGQTDQDFSAARRLQALNWVYRQEVNKMHLEGHEKWFLSTVEFTWPSGQLTYQLAPNLQQTQLIYMQDITKTDPGEPIIFGPSDHTGRIHWKDRNTLQWGTEGPGEDKTIRAAFYALANNLVEDDDEPELLPEQYHELLIWGAGVLLYEAAEHEPPVMWMRELDEMRMDMHKLVSRGRPMDNVPTVRIVDPDPDDGVIYS